MAVLGAGPAGLGAALALSRSGVDVTVFERAEQVGGLCRSMELWGEPVELGAHLLVRDDPTIDRLWEELIGDDCDRVPRRTSVLVSGRRFAYPFRPIDVARRVGAVRLASMVRGAAASGPVGRVRSPRTSSPGRWDGTARPAFATLLDGYTDKLFGLAPRGRRGVRPFARRRASCGTGGGGGVPTPGRRRCAPRRGRHRGRAAGGSVRCGTEVARLAVAGGRVEGLERPDGGVERFDHVVSTLPLPLLLGRLLDAPEPLVRRLAALRSRAAVLVYLRARAAPRFPEQWVYVFGRRHRVGRVTNYGSFTAARPTGPTTVSAELWCDPDDETWSAPDAEVVDLATRELGELGLVAPSSVVDHHVVRIRSAFPVLARGYRGAVTAAEEHLSGVGGLTSTGRWGGFTNGGVHENLLAGLRVGGRLATVREVRRAPLGSPG